MELSKFVAGHQKPEKIENNKLNNQCPVCWGYQQYDRKFRKIYKDRQVDVNNHQRSYMLVEEFVKTYVDGVRLKESKEIACSVCAAKD